MAAKIRPTGFRQFSSSDFLMDAGPTITAWFRRFCLRGYLILALLPGVVACKGEGERVPDPPAPLETVTLEQFRSLFWLEGRWRGTLNDTAPFFEA